MQGSEVQKQSTSVKHEHEKRRSGSSHKPPSQSAPLLFYSQKKPVKKDRRAKEMAQRVTAFVTNPDDLNWISKKEGTNSHKLSVDFYKCATTPSPTK